VANKLVRANASVTLTIRVENCGAWGSECEISQVHKQAKEVAIERVRFALGKAQNGKYTIVGEPSVTSVIVEEM
jgi:hypothetical protein